MGKVTFAAVIYERFRNKDGKYPVKLRVTYRQTPTYFATNLVADPSDLSLNSKEKNMPVRNNALKRKIQALVSEYEVAAESFNPDFFPEWTVGQVMAYLNKIVYKNIGFKLDFVRYTMEFVEEKKKASPKAANNYKYAINSLCMYIGKDSFDVAEITSTLMRGWEEWLCCKYGKDARAVSLYTSAIAAVHKSARLQYNTEELGEVNIKNPFEYYTPPKQPTSRHRDVEPGIIQQMINEYQGLTGRERLAVGAFLLSFSLMGMNTPDLYTCAPAKKGILHYCRLKTRNRRSDHAEMYVRIPECIMPLYEEYRDKTGSRAFHFHIRYASYANMQDAEIKGMEQFKDKIKYKGRLTNYSARHTWATIARSRSCGINMDVIDDCLAHAGHYTQGDVYAKKDYSVLWAANEKVLATLDWGPLRSPQSTKD